MVKAVARAFRWRNLLENGMHATIAEIAAAEKVNESYVGRVLRLTRRSWMAARGNYSGGADEAISDRMECPASGCDRKAAGSGSSRNPLRAATQPPPLPAGCS
jgi:hypothetical protein